MIVLKNAAVFDGQSDTLLKGCSVIVDHGRIIEVREQDKKTDWQLETIDLQGCTLLPGLIDCHMHLLLYEVPDRDIQFNDRTPGGGELENGMATSRSAARTPRKRCCFPASPRFLTAAGLAMWILRCGMQSPRGLLKGRPPMSAANRSPPGAAISPAWGWKRSARTGCAAQCVHCCGMA